MSRREKRAAERDARMQEGLDRLEELSREFQRTLGKLQQVASEAAADGGDGPVAELAAPVETSESGCAS